MWVVTISSFAFLFAGGTIFVFLLGLSMWILSGNNIPLAVVQQVIFGSIDKFSLLAIPYFIFAGELMARGSMSKRLIDWVLAIFGKHHGSVPMATVGASTIFGAVSGSSPATVAAVGRMMYPILKESGYNTRFSSGLVTAAGGIAIVIPPSIAMILYAASAEQSIADLFLAGVIPGIFLAILLGGYSYLYASRQGIREGQSFNFSRVLTTTRRGFWALLMPAIVLGGIYAGVFSPTEAAGIACVYALVVSLFIYRDLSFAEVWRISIGSAALTGQILLLVCAAGVISWLVTTQGIPGQIAATIQDLGLSKWSYLLIVNVLLLIVGCVLDPVSAILVLTPLLAPIAQSLGIDLVHFGLIMTVNLSIGMFSPPFGLNIFVAQASLKVPTHEIYKGVLPLLVVYGFGLAIITIFPSISLFLLDIL
ncbi:MAG: C4-dicarboxylate transporter [Sneathiella sp.]|jgi:C4-dicarboxylate transporter DctM subunit|uniref:TRAP transporter large permease n=1 Tax=Sneathiella sp. TaxID=1964365 RepID=UPI000C48BD9F|nr:TRAP transporter large permease [Sneathiella sp.]MAL80767.1 C4-dicarboxylate transporter [Sneathiella sp.]|tara:strand:- start:4760 stop:6025 length:1266 start_codon:yes stop_codon:yes gene_type:complete